MSLCLALGAAAAGLVLCGCEVGSADSRIEITPSSSVLHHKGQSVTLTASGGYRYEWKLSNSQWGYLSSYRGEQVVYTSMYVPHELAAVQVVTVTSRFSDRERADGAGGGTNIVTTGVVFKAEAYITHYAAPLPAE